MLEWNLTFGPSRSSRYGTPISATNCFTGNFDSKIAAYDVGTNFEDFDFLTILDAFISCNEDCPGDPNLTSELSFNVNPGESVNFTPPTAAGVDVRNVIGRVTGASPSSINGRISSTIPNADLFLFNRNGIAFGPSASISVPGSFYFSTANSLNLADGGVFYRNASGALMLAYVAAGRLIGYTEPHMNPWDCVASTA